MSEFYQTFKEEVVPYLLNYYKKMKREECFQTHFTRPGFSSYKNQTKKTHKKENHRPISLINIHAEMLNKILANQIQEYIKRAIHRDQLGIIPRM